MKIFNCLLLMLTLAGCGVRTQPTPQEQLDQTKFALQRALDALPLLNDLLGTAVSAQQITEEDAETLRELGREAQRYLLAALDIANGIDDPNSAREVLRAALGGTADGVDRAFEIIPPESTRLREVLGWVGVGVRTALLFT